MLDKTFFIYFSCGSLWKLISKNDMQHRPSRLNLSAFFTGFENSFKRLTQF